MTSLALMGPLVIILILIHLQGFQVRIDLFTDGKPIEFSENRLMNPLTNSIGLSAFSLGLAMLDLIQLQIQLIGMVYPEPHRAPFPDRSIPY